MAHLMEEDTAESRGETWTCAGGNERRKAQLTDRLGHREACIQSRTSVEITDQCGQTPGNSL